MTGHQKHRDPRFPPYAFTEHGAIMAAAIISSPRAIEMSLYVVRAFVRLPELLVSNTALARKLDELERKYQHHDDAIKAILSAIRELRTRRLPGSDPSDLPPISARSADSDASPCGPLGYKTRSAPILHTCPHALGASPVGLRLSMCEVS